VTIPDLIHLPPPTHGVIFDPKGELAPLIAARKKEKNS
jgi:type IV secretory pathway TraG/TraD family ATPase VirD4